MTQSATVDAVSELLGPWMSRQRWASREKGDQRISVDHAELLFDQGRAPRVLWYMVRTADDAQYQALVALRSDADAIDLGERDVLGFVESEEGKLFAYDAMADPEAVRPLAGQMGLPGAAEMTVRPVGAEQSNTSVVLGDKEHGDRAILKLYRRIRPGPNPDVEVPAGLDRVGFNHLAAPLAVWRRGDFDLAVAQEYLAGGVEGWALALASLRDLYADTQADPTQAGGDLSGEARRIGEMTGRLHLALAEAFGLSPNAVDSWTEVTTSQADALGLEVGQRRAVDEVVGRVRRLAETGTIGPSIRVHGDYHLGQIMRTDNGWYVLDFEGEPARSLEERRLPWPALKDVAGMLRSFDYAAGVGLTERMPSERDGLTARGHSWAESNRAAFLHGYAAVEGIGALLPEGDPDSRATAKLTSYFELDKALYELAYERSHRPDWEWIPAGAIEALLAG
ncbi:MAG TPA: phosphotransferase [Acidimicrobiales bacterium]|nr:phosphotransferase [Acidimicrobiales bacterium]